jgi:hypothetical protein
VARACQSISCIPRRLIVLPHHQSFELLPRPRPRLRPVRPKSTPLLRIQKPAIVECRGDQPINSITSSTIANRVDRSTRREHPALWARTLMFLIARTGHILYHINNVRDKLLSSSPASKITTLSSNPPKSLLYSTNGLLNSSSLSSLISLSTSLASFLF